MKCYTIGMEYARCKGVQRLSRAVKRRITTELERDHAYLLQQGIVQALHHVGVLHVSSEKL